MKSSGTKGIVFPTEITNSLIWFSINVCGSVHQKELTLSGTQVTGEHYQSVTSSSSSGREPWKRGCWQMPRYQSRDRERTIYGTGLGIVVWFCNFPRLYTPWQDSMVYPLPPGPSRICLEMSSILLHTWMPLSCPRRQKGLCFLSVPSGCLLCFSVMAP